MTGPGDALDQTEYIYLGIGHGWTRKAKDRQGTESRARVVAWRPDDALNHGKMGYSRSLEAVTTFVIEFHQVSFLQYTAFQ